MDYRANYTFDNNVLLVHNMIIDILTKFGNISINKLFRTIPIGLDLKALILASSHIYELSEKKVRALVNQKYKRRKK